MTKSYKKVSKAVGLALWAVGVFSYLGLFFRHIVLRPPSEPLLLYGLFLAIALVGFVLTIITTLNHGPDR